MFPDLPTHPMIVHFPLALFIVSPLLALAGLLRDTSWLRRAAAVLFVIGFVGAVAALRTGEGAEEAAEKQGVPEQAIERHEDAGKLLTWVSGLGVVALIATSARAVRPAAGVALLLIQLACAALAVNAGYHGGRLVYEHGAGVSVAGQPVQNPGGDGAIADDGED